MLYSSHMVIDPGLRRLEVCHIPADIDSRNLDNASHNNQESIEEDEVGREKDSQSRPYAVQA